VRFSIILCFALIGCSEAKPLAEQSPEISATEISEEQKLMEKIESLVQLPQEAYSIEDYGRNYAMNDDGTVSAIYTIPPRPRPSDAKCSVYEDGDLRPCTDRENEEEDQRRKAMVAREAKRDESRWFESADDLPMILDGGCSVIWVGFDPKTERVAASCNGVA
jgi:hypothetical protein